ncbi:MAG: patatin-like phospholipase family protein [Acetobacteraceae bacterium]|nr:patatin-like phospholipase family protein [Acetobacteraceae bacterium]
MPHPPPDPRCIALVLQGGGALGSYQAGVYEALAGADYLPDWVAGISIGAINAALIVGNPPADRVAKLAAFWEGITAPSACLPAAFQRRTGALGAIAFGQPGFFRPRTPLEMLPSNRPPSLYDTSALKTTLERLVDFDRINAGPTRLSVGAVHLRTGNFAYFDSATTKLRAEHIMASGALPPGFPAVEIDGEQYWDGGLVSNTPLAHVIETLPRSSRLIFQVDLYSARGELPTTMDEVGARLKDIRYSSRTRAVSDGERHTQDVRHNINALLSKLPPELRALPEAEFLYHCGCPSTMDIVQLIYRPAQPHGQSKDYEFSRATMRERWDQGRADGETTLRAAPWLVPMPPELGARSHDVVFEQQRRAKK